jgi:hypothetical protein
MTVTWGALFDRASGAETALSDIETAITAVEREDSTHATADQESPNGDTEAVVADVDVLVADLFLGGSARQALDHVRGHSWVELVASGPLLARSRAAIEAIGSDELATEWHGRATRECRLVAHPADDHPALASAYRSGAHHLLTFDDSLTATETNLGVQPHMDLSVRPPDAFAGLFDPESLYEHLFEESYPGPDRDPRA